MTYLYYKTSTTTVGNQKPSKETIDQLKFLSDKKHWRITQLPNGFYQTEVLRPNTDDEWGDVTRRETIDGAEEAINASIEHFSKRLEASSGPKVIKTFK
tara:strand:- start:184 stop:480 length:297 start_codon:yes stop_codon:yes gene_type:complete